MRNTQTVEIGTPYFEVIAENGQFNEKPVGYFKYKQDALKAASRFLNATVIRYGHTSEREVYSHVHNIPDGKESAYTLEDLKKV